MLFRSQSRVSHQIPLDFILNGKILCLKSNVWEPIQGRHSYLWNALTKDVNTRVDRHSEPSHGQMEVDMQKIR